MSWTLAGEAIPSPHSKRLIRDVQSVVHRTLSGGYSRDFIGSEKKVIEAEYESISTDDRNRIVAHYEAQRDFGYSKNLTIPELSFNANVLIEVGDEDYVIPNYYRYRKFKVVFREV